MTVDKALEDKGERFPNLGRDGQRGQDRFRG